MKIAAISDLHGHLIENLPECDILCISGDLCPARDHSISFQTSWLETNFTLWLKSLENVCKNIVFIAGNHDWFFQEASEYQIKHFTNNLPEHCHYLFDSVVIIDGVVVYGTPWQLHFCDWAFNLSEMELEGKFNKMPDKVDILLSHSPPYGFGDTIMQWGEENKLGSKALLKIIYQRKVRYSFFGHIHSGNHKLVKGRKTKFANVSLLDESYEVTYPPLEIEI